MQCKGSWVLGTACGKCDRCRDTAEDAVEVIRQLRNERDDLSSAVSAYRDRMRDAAELLDMSK